jgi:hypothetical protein
MSSKVKYPDDYIREKRSIIAAAELTYVRKSGDDCFSVVTGEGEYAMLDLGEAINFAASHILGDGPLDSVQFSAHADDEWHPDMHILCRELEEAGRRHKR